MHARTRNALALTLGLAAILTSSAAAQETAPENTPVRVRGIDVDTYSMEAPRREIVGFENGDNGFRARTPVLARGSTKPATVDLDMLRRRKLAMYEDGHVFHAPLPMSGVSEQPVQPPPEKVAPPAEIPPEPTPIWKWMLGIAFCAVAAALARAALGSRS